MSIFTKKPVEDFDTPSQLAQELDGHTRRFEAGRQNVIDRGTAKVGQIKQLRAELNKELEDHTAILARA